MFRSCCWLSVVATLLGALTLPAEEKAKEIFNGKDLDGWVAEGAT